MSKCAECGMETELRELGLPVCTACISKRESLHPLLSSLRADLASARNLYRQALEDFEHHQARHRRFPSPQAERVEAARLEEKARTAGEKYWEALRLYGETLRKQEEPGGDSAST
jgi:hypothetical protein